MTHNVTKVTNVIIEDLREYLYYDTGQLLPQSTFNMIFDSHMLDFIRDLQVDIDAEVLNIEEYKNSLEDE
jgi:hypothetical protein